jgi:hypothetical protein
MTFNDFTKRFYAKMEDEGVGISIKITESTRVR